MFSNVNNVSSNWNSVYSNVNNVSSNWNSVYSTFGTQSANNLSGYTTLNGLSANDKSVYSQVNSLSTNWNSVYSTFGTQSANNLSVFSNVNNVSSNWNSVYSYTNITSGVQPYTVVFPSSSIQPHYGSNTSTGAYSFIAAGVNNSTSLSNTFILGSNIIAGSANYTYVNNLSSLVAINTNTLTVAGESDFATITETLISPVISSNILNLNLASGTFFKTNLTSTVSVNFNNPPPAGKVFSFTLQFVANGSQYIVTWPTSVKWSGGIVPTITSTNGKIDTLSFFTTDGGTSYFGFLAGQNA